MLSGTLKPGEYLITDVGAVAILSLMTCARVVNIHVARDFETDTKNLVLFIVKQFVPLDDDTIHLTGRDIDTQFQELFQYQRLGHMRMIVLVDNEAIQGGTKVTAEGLNLIWKRSYNVAALGGSPPLPPVERIEWLQKQV